MTTWLLAGGGTAGHVNPLLAVADELRAERADDTVLVLGTPEGLEARLVPARGYRLLTVPKVVFPRRPGRAAVRFPGQLRGAVRTTRRIFRDEGVDAVIGFGGFASAPAYLAARGTRVPVTVHEANIRPGLANRLGARRAAAVGVAFPGTPLPHAQVVGMPLRREIEAMSDARIRASVRVRGLERFGFEAERPVLLVTGGSQGSRRLNEGIVGGAEALIAAGWQVLHIAGQHWQGQTPELPGYRLLPYLDEMHLALAVASFAVARAGAATVSELAALGIPAVYVPLPFGNGEQARNVAAFVSAGAAGLVDDAAFTPEWVSGVLAPLLADRPAVEAMRAALGTLEVIGDGSRRTVGLALSTLRAASRNGTR